MAKTAKRSQTRKRYKTAKGTKPQKVQNRKRYKTAKKIGGTFMSTSWNKPVKFSGVYNSKTLEQQYAYLNPTDECVNLFDKILYKIILC
jgi:hypothetical protein